MTRLELIQLRVSLDEKAKIHELQKILGYKSVSDYFRVLLLQKENVFQLEDELKKQVLELDFVMVVLQRIIVNLKCITNQEKSITKGITK